MFHHRLPGPKLNPGPSQSAPTHTPCLYKHCSHKKIPAGRHAPAGPKWILSQQRGGGSTSQKHGTMWLVYTLRLRMPPSIVSCACPVDNAWGSEVISHISPLSPVSEQFPSLEQCNSKLWHTWNACRTYVTLNSLMLTLPENVTYACSVLLYNTYMHSNI